MSDIGRQHFQPYLSIVCAFASAQREPEWLAQTRRFLAVTARQAERYRLPLEIILVDRDTFGNSEPAASLLTQLPRNEFAEIRIIATPGSEMVSGHPIDRERRLQNVGIRRARGAFVLAAGTDIILGAGLVKLLAARILREDVTYHALRIDTAPTCPALIETDAIDVEAQCRAAAFAAALMPARGAFDGRLFAASDDTWNDAMRRIGIELDPEKMSRALELAQGNFLLMARKSWLELGGFPEWNVGDFFFDRIAVTQARYRGWPATVMPVSCHYFSFAALREPPIERDIYVDADGDLRIRIEVPAIRHFNNWQSGKLLAMLNRTALIPPAGNAVEIRVNSPQWGLSGFDLPEVTSTAPNASSAEIVQEHRA